MNILNDLAYYDFYQSMLTLFIILFSISISIIIAIKDVKDIKYILMLYVWHTFFSFYYWYHSLSNVADATLYYTKSFNLDLNLSPGTRFTESVSYVIVKILNSSYLNTTLVFNFFGSLGLIFLYLALKKYILNLNRYWFFILLIPSMSFWSAGLGKDSIAFMATCLFLYGIVESKRPKMIIFFAFIVMFMVRPHIAFMMLISFIIYFIVSVKSNALVKITVLLLVFAGLFLSLGFIQQYVGLENTSIEDIGSYVDKRQSYNQNGDSSLDIASMSYPMQVFTYIFRPLPFEAHSLLAFITSLENTLLLLLLLYILFKSKFNFKAFFKDKNLWLFTYIFLTCTILAVTTANLGIATRQKWMFMPMFIYLLIYAFYDYKYNKKIEKYD